MLLAFKVISFCIHTLLPAFVYRHKAFSRDHKNLSDAVRDGRSKSTVTHIDFVKKLNTSDHYGIYDVIETSLNISRTNVHSILHAHLEVKKIYCQ